ncbi:MAG: hypothetical protein AMK69_20965 [Nitrospira bacterium SG8_3]|nr:MAG: hypothetical protein AMK69_20965 [Nitrospira bacterium SG8_3]
MRVSFVDSFMSAVFFSVVLSGCTSPHLKDSGNEQDARPIEFQKIVEFEREVHFMTPEGRDTVIQPGGYLVEAVPDGLQLQSADREKVEAVIVQADPVTHEQSVDGPEPLVVQEGDDQQVVMVLMPGGEGLQATGFYEVIQNRGLTLQSKIPNLRKKITIQPKIKPLPTISGILSTPTMGVSTPGGTLYIKGENFGEYKEESGQGKVLIYGNFWWGASWTALSVMEWSPTKIIAKLEKGELAYKNRDQQIKLQIKTARGFQSQSLQMPFRARRTTKWLDFNDPAVKLVYCSGGGDANLCNGHSPPGGWEMCPLLAGIPTWQDRQPAIYAQHKNCDLIVDVDDGSDQYAIELKNGWVFKSFGLSREKTSSSEKITLPTYSQLNSAVVGTTVWTPRISWKVSPGFDSVHYAIYVEIEGPNGIPHF